MNIFVLDYNPKICAKYHCDRHVVKMILESAQILSTVINSKLKMEVTDLYKSTHVNHPVVKWVKKSKQNFDWLLELSLYLCDEYNDRYEKTHKSLKVLERCALFSKIFRDKGLTPFALCMPDEYKTNDVVESYRNYYIAEKRFAKWKKGNIPEWWK